METKRARAGIALQRGQLCRSLRGVDANGQARHRIGRQRHDLATLEMSNEVGHGEEWHQGGKGTSQVGRRHGMLVS